MANYRFFNSTVHVIFFIQIVQPFRLTLFRKFQVQFSTIFIGNIGRHFSVNMNRNLRACTSVIDEKLYTLEVFVDSVSIYSEKLHKILPNELGVDLQFIDMPLFRIFQSDFLLTKPDRSKELTREIGIHTIHFNAGKMYLFTRNPGELIEKMRQKPLLLDVYKIKEIQICPEEVIKHPLGNSTIPIPGCLCDHVTMAGNDIYHLPKSYQINNTFALVDEEYKPSGSIRLFLRLTCYGTYTIHPYSIVEKKLLFRNAGSFNEFLCTKVPYPDEDERRAAEASTKFCMPDKVFEESELDAPPKPVNIAGLIFVCKELSQRDGFPPNVISPNYPPKIPEVHTEEIEFNIDKARRKGFKVIEQPDIVVDRKTIPSYKECINIGCAGNICTGQK